MTNETTEDLDDTLLKSPEPSRTKESNTQIMERLVEEQASSAVSYSVLKHIDALTGLQERDDCIRSLHIIRTRVAALVEAADSTVSNSHVLANGLTSVRRADLHALSAALLPFKGEK